VCADHAKKRRKKKRKPGLRLGNKGTRKKRKNLLRSQVLSNDSEGHRRLGKENIDFDRERDEER
jgi:hypothetical protein